MIFAPGILLVNICYLQVKAYHIRVLPFSVTTATVAVEIALPSLRGYPAKGPYLPCVSMVGRALLAGYHRLAELF